MEINMKRFVQGHLFPQLQLYILLVIIIDVCMSDISCDFNNGKMCDDWQFEYNSSVCAANWTIWKGATQTVNTGPSRDRLYKDGYYIYMETTNQRHPDIAIFYTPVLQSVSGVVVNTSFWYYMHGVFIQNLKLYILPLFSVDDRELLMTIAGEQGDAWKFARVYFQPVGPFQVEFQATVGSTSSDIAVDDIAIQGTDKYIPTTVSVLHVKSTLATTVVTGNTSEAERDNSVPLGYIIICSIGGLLWAVILLLLCLCIYRADKLAHSMRSVACNTTFTNVTEDSKNDGANFPLQTQHFVDHGDDISFANIELVLDINRLTINKDKWETKL